MRFALCASLFYGAALLFAQTARGATIVSPGPPAVPADYIEVNLDWLPSDPGFVKARLINGDIDSAVIIDQHFWAQRTVEGGTPQYRGWVETRYAPAQNISATVITLLLQPEIDAGLASVNVLIGERNGNIRPVTVTGAGGYNRTYTATLIPEPAAAILATLGSAMLLRRRK
jgi:hypothetical protein